MNMSKQVQSRKAKNPSPKVGRQVKPNVKQIKALQPKNPKSVAAAYSTGQLGTSPKITQTRDSCRVVHRELIASITGTTAFTVANSFALNPGVAATFPWLSVMAQCWEQYRFRRLRFCYFTRTGSNIPGSLMLSPDYDASDSSPVSEQIASSYDDTAEDAPWKNINCDLPSRRMNASYPKHFTRSGDLASNLDIKTYDVGKLSVITLDGTAVFWGKLWVEYDVEFSIPQLPPVGSLPLGGAVTGANTQTGANPFGVAPILTAQSKGFSIDNASIVTFTALGDYVLGAAFSGTVISVIPQPTLGAGCTLISYQGSFPTAATTATSVLVVRVTSLVAATAAYSLTATTITAGLLFIGNAASGAL
jgi:hypothetical protein